MRSKSWSRCLLLGLATALWSVTPAVAVDAAGSGPRIETIAPEPTDIIDLYEGSLDPNNALTGGLVHPADAFDWWCLNVQAGVALEIEVAGSAGSRPNAGLVQGIVATGDQFQELGQILGATNNGSEETATLTVIPAFSGPATVWIANAGTAFNISYAVSMTGGTINQSCNPCPDCPTDPAVNFNDKARFIVGTQRNVSGGFVDVPLLVDSGERVTFSKMTVDFDGSCLTFVNAVAGAGVTAPGPVTIVPSGSPTNKVSVLVTGEYGPACRTEVFVLRFALAAGGSPPCTLTLDRVTGGANPPNHVIADRDQNGVGETILVGDANGFCDGVVDVANLALTKSVDIANPAEGAQVAFTVTVTNNGPTLASGIVVTDLLPAGLTYVSNTPSQGAYVPGTGAWSAGSLANGAAATLTLRATVNAGQAGATITNSASVTAMDQADPNSGNNTANRAITVQSANLGLTKIVDIAAPNVGQQVAFTVTVSNAGPNVATAVGVTDLLPSGLTYVSHTASQGTYTPGTGAWSVGVLGVGSQATLALRATVNTGTGGTTITNMASVTNVVPPDPVPGNNTAMASVNVTSADLRVTKTVNNATPNVGQAIAFTVTASNLGPSNATGVVVNDLLPAGLTYTSHTASCGSYVPGTGVWTIGALANGGNCTLTLNATVNTGTGGTAITNIATITGQQSDPVPGNNSASATVNVTSADLRVTKTVNNATPNVGQAIAFTVTASNLGPSNATGVVVNDLLPAGLTYTSHTASCGTYTPGTGVWTIGALNNGGNCTLTLNATVNTGTGGTTITNTATISGQQSDPVPGNNSASAAVNVTSADLRVTKTVNNATPNVGQAIAFTVTASNFGPSNATGVVVNDLLPAGLTYTSHTASCGSYVPGTGVWTIGALANGGNCTLTLNATVNTGTGGTTITNTATISGQQSDPAPGNNSASAAVNVTSADLRVTKTVDDPTPDVGQAVVFTVMASNLGPSNATGVVVSDLLPAGLTYTSHTASCGTYVPGTGVWTIGNLANGASCTLTLNATVTGTGGTTITNTVTINGQQSDPVPGNNTASAAVTVQSADLGVTKTVNIATPNVGQAIVFTVTATNHGPHNATAVVATDALPAGLTYTSHTASCGTYVPGTGVWTIGALNNGASCTLTLNATVNTGTGGTTITNMATITGGQFDPVPGNNTASVTVSVQSCDMEITKTADDATPVVGQLLVYTVNATNLGPSGATGLQVTDLLPAGITYVSHTTVHGTYTPGSGVWNIGSLGSGLTAILTLRGTVNTGTAGTTIVNMAAVTAVNQSDPVPGNNSASASVTVDCADVDLAGTVRYYSNLQSILPAIPDPTSVAVTVRDCGNHSIADNAVAGTYELSYGDGPFPQLCVCAIRPRADCNSFEGAVISGQDLILIEDIIAQSGPAPTPRQRVAADLNKDGAVLSNDRLAIAQWIGHAAVCGGTTCTGQPTDNCAGTWRFLYPTGAGPGDFTLDNRCLTNVCVDQTVAIEGVLLGDVDGSWPSIFPTAAEDGVAAATKPVGFALEIAARDGDLVTVALWASVGPGGALHHVIYSLDYDATAFEYMGAQVAGRASEWGLFDNPQQSGTAHGVVHRRGGMAPIVASGEVLRFQFRARSADAEPRFAFSRLKANDIDVEAEDGRPDSAVPVRYALTSTPNPFNPSTRIEFAIPGEAGAVAVTLRVYDISGRLVRTLVQDRRGPGRHSVEWNGTDDRGNGVGTGIYFLQIRAGTWSNVRKLVLLK